MTTGNEQYQNKESFYHLEICCRLIGEKLGEQNIVSWTNGDYIRLSSALSNKTSVQISPSTLKRIFGKLKTPERYYPQKATRDALAQFAGYKDWDNFVIKNPKGLKTGDSTNGPISSSENIERPTPAASDKKRKKIWIFYLLTSAAMLAIVIWQVAKKENNSELSPADVTFTCNNPEGGNPHSATFKLTLPKNFTGNASDFKVNFGDGRRLRQGVVSGSVITHYYEVPGRYYAILNYSDKPLDTVPVYLKSSGWTATAIMEHDSMRVYPVNHIGLFKNGNLTVQAPEVSNSGIDTGRTFYVHFANTRPLNIDGDNFELTADITSSRVRPGLRCSQFNLEVFGEMSKHEIILMKPECVVWSLLRFSENFKDGELDDLSSIGIDLSKRGSVKLQVADKMVKLFINEKLVHESSYRTALKEIYGVKIIFSGIGTIHDLYIRDLKSGETFHEGFSNTSLNKD